MTRILMATDGSEPAELAVRVAAGLATPGSILRAVSVVTSGFGPVSGPLEGADPTARHEAALRKARTITGVRDLQLDLRRGDATEIVRAAEEFGVHLVVTGSRSYGLLATVLPGSVSAAVVDRAPCPVLVVRKASVEPGPVHRAWWAARPRHGRRGRDRPTAGGSAGGLTSTGDESRPCGTRATPGPSEPCASRSC